MDSKAEWYTVGGSIFSPYSLLCQGLIFCLISSIFFLYRKIPLFSIGIAWYFISSILYIQIFPLFTIAGVRYIYTPSLGLMLALFSLIYKCSNINLRNFLLVLSIPFFLFLTARTIYYLPSSKDQLAQLIYCTEEAPLWNKPRYIEETLDYAITNKQEKDLPRWLNKKAHQDSILEWLDKYSNIEPSLSIKFGPMQMAYNYYSFRGIFNFLYYSGQLEKLEAVMSTALKVNDGWLGWYEIAKFCREMKQWKLGWEALTRAIKLSPSFKDSYNLRFVELAVSSDNIKEAENLVQNYIKLKPTSSHPYLFAGLFYYQINEISTALAYFKEALLRSKSIGIGDDGLYYYAGNVFMKYNLFEDARNAFNTILSFDPYNEKAKNKLVEMNKLVKSS